MTSLLEKNRSRNHEIKKSAVCYINETKILKIMEEANTGKYANRIPGYQFRILAQTSPNFPLKVSHS